MKKKLITHDKSYQLENSPLFKIQYTKRLSQVILQSEETISSVFESKAQYYNIFQQGNRLIEVPLRTLYAIHNRIASLLARITPPDYLYSGIKNKSYITNAQQHLDSDVILTTDITAFFPSTTKEKIFWFFKDKMQCSTKIANHLAELCTIDGHLPTGSQISMPLAYWVNANMFDELNRLAKENELKMTVYVDDVTFSGARIPKEFKFLVERTIKKYRHSIKLEKTKLYKSQSAKEVTGLILKDGKLLPSNRQIKKLHQYLNLWGELLSQPRQGRKIEWLYPKLVGVVNNIAYFKPEYRNVVFAIHREYNQYKNTPSNYKKEV
ncbi:reverse transcriptase family protein [Pasteurella multocida]|uniref:reverse transcriptase family protein n=1 Tax=Pasteurella multocida TaxID=747 RepID=UPI001F52C190|nr:reverse transcriptase family protein [Pasteurella multocida]